MRLLGAHVLEIFGVHTEDPDGDGVNGIRGNAAKALADKVGVQGLPSGRREDGVECQV